MSVMLRPTAMRPWFLILIATVPLTACSGHSTVDPGAESMAGIERAAVRPAGDGREEALASGVLRADPKSGCLWLEQPDGSVGAQLLLYGEEYRVDFSTKPASIRDGDDVVARVGEQVEVGGGFGTDDGVTDCPVSAPSFLGYF